MKRFVIPILVVALAVSGAALAGKADKKKDAERIAQLEARVEALEQALAQLQQSGGNADLEGMIDRHIAQREQRAANEFRVINDLVNQGKQLEAKQRMDDFQNRFAGTQASQGAARFARELEVVGKPAPANVQAQKWYVGEGTSLDLSGKGTSLLVFFEEWCPHCRREMPKLQQTYDKFKADGLQVIGLTKVTKSATDEKVATFCSQSKVEFPVIKEGGELSRYFNVSGIPAAAVVQDGKVVWRGHPGRLSETMLKSWL